MIVDPAPADRDPADPEVRLTVVKPKKVKTPVAVGAESGAGDADELAGSEDAPADGDAEK